MEAAMASNWDQAKSTAMGILGSQAKIPEPKANYTKFIADMAQADKEYAAAVSVLQDKILNLQNRNSTMRNFLKQLRDQVASTNFGLPATEKDKIAKAQKVLEGALDPAIQGIDTEIKNLEELDRHSMAIAKYQPHQH
jgi:hypothetical protein